MKCGVDCKGIEYEEIPIGRSNDLTDKIYGYLTCLCRVKPNKDIKSRDTFWLCECICGNIVVASAHSLNRGETISCGCYRIQRVSDVSKKNEEGNVFGYLTATDKSVSINNKIHWLCKCRCGNEILVSGISLRNGNTRSCGCLHKEHVYSTCLKNEVGNKYGHLTVIRQAESKIYSDGKSYSQWLCKCDCGREIITKGITLRLGNIQSCGCITSKGEAKIKNILDENKISYITQYIIDGCISKKGYPLKFDFAILDNNNILLCLIEYQGIQHYEKTLWNSPLENDKIKKNYCNKHNIKLIEIPYWDYKKIDWDYIKNIIENNTTETN